MCQEAPCCEVSVKRHAVFFLFLFWSADQEWCCWFMGVRNHGHRHSNRSLQYHVFLHCSASTGKRASMVSVTRGPCGILISSLSFKRNHTHKETQNVWMYRCPIIADLRLHSLSRFLIGKEYRHVDLYSTQDKSLHMICTLCYSTLPG